MLTFMYKSYVWFKAPSKSSVKFCYTLESELFYRTVHSIFHWNIRIALSDFLEKSVPTL